MVDKTTEISASLKDQKMTQIWNKKMLRNVIKPLKVRLRRIKINPMLLIKPLRIQMKKKSKELTQWLE